MIRNFKNIIKEIEEFASNHNEIHSFDWGHTSKISTTDTDFKLLFLQPTTINRTQESSIYNFTLYVIDLLKHDKSNLLDVMNSCDLIGLDFFAKYYDNDSAGFYLQEQVTGNFFDEYFDEYTAGVYYDISLEVDNRLNECSIPENLS